MKKLILSVAMMSAVLAGSQAYAQEQEHKDSEKGYVTGSFESNSNYYVKDSKEGYCDVYYIYFQIFYNNI